MNEWQFDCHYWQPAELTFVLATPCNVCLSAYCSWLVWCVLFAQMRWSKHTHAHAYVCSCTCVSSKYHFIVVIYMFVCLLQQWVVIKHCLLVWIKYTYIYLYMYVYAEKCLRKLMCTYAHVKAIFRWNTFVADKYRSQGKSK